MAPSKPLPTVHSLGATTPLNPGSSGYIVIDSMGGYHQIVTNFDHLIKIGWNDSIKVGDTYINLWDVLYECPGSKQQGRYLIIDEKYAKYIEMYVKHFTDYAGIALKEFLNHMVHEDD